MNKSACANLTDFLKTKPDFLNYSKGQVDTFDLLKDRLSQAKQNAARTLQSLKDVGGSDHHCNPSTLMHKLVEELESLAEEQKQ